jgi:dethiobiotin synthetase
LIIEGAGGVLVPINDTYLMVDLIKKLGAPVILVARTTLGTINHTLLSLEALRSRNITVLGVIMNGEQNTQNSNSIELYGRTSVLAEFPKLESVSMNTLQGIALPQKLKQILEVQ